MKQLFFTAIVSGAVFLSTFSYAQHKYVYKPNAATSVAKERKYAHTPRVNSALSSRLRPAAVNDPPIINDPINIYASENSMDIELLDATLYVHFAASPTQTQNLISNIDYEFTCSPDYFYHDAQHILVSDITTRNTSIAGVNEIQLYKKSFNHWSVTYNDFVIKYSDNVHSHRNYNYWERFQGGGIELKLPGNDSVQVNKMILVLKFSKGTKTIVWDTPKNSTSATNAFTTFSYLKFKFNQNFEPMN